MPVGIRQKDEQAKINRGYESDPMHGLAEQFVNAVRGVNESCGIDIYSEPSKFMMHDSSKSELKRLFVEDSFFEDDPEFKNNAEAQQFREECMGELFENVCDAVNESAPLGQFNPVIGISFPMYKNLLFNCAFAKAIPNDVAVQPKIPLTMETRTLVDTNGNEIDIFLRQNEIHDAVANSVPNHYITLALPEDENTDVIGKYFNGVGDLSQRTVVCGVVINQYVADKVEYIDATGAKKTGTGVMVDAVCPINDIEFRPSYGEFDSSFIERFEVAYSSAVPASGAAATITTAKGVLQGYMKKNKFMLTCTNKDVKGVYMHAIADVSSAIYKTCTTKWSARTDMFTIPEAPHITVSISPEEVKDVNALYQTNQVTKLMSIMNLTLANYKDDELHLQLDKSFMGLPDSQKIQGAFDFCPPTNYNQDPVSWRQSTFMDQLDSYVTSMIQILNDENVTITVIGRPDLVRKVTPTQYVYQTPGSIGPVELEYTRTIVSSDKRVYQFMSTSKMRNINSFIIILSPRNTNRVMYKLFDYQFYVSNEIRSTDNYQLPAITAFERWKMIQYQPVQGRLQIVNPRGLREVLTADDPIGTSAMNDYSANTNTHSSTVNGAIVPTGKANW